MITPCAYTKSVNGKEMQVKIKIKWKQRLQICKCNNNGNDGVLINGNTRAAVYTYLTPLSLPNHSNNIQKIYMHRLKWTSLIGLKITHYHKTSPSLHFGHSSLHDDKETIHCPTCMGDYQQDMNGEYDRTEYNT